MQTRTRHALQAGISFALVGLIAAWSALIFGEEELLKFTLAALRIYGAAIAIASFCAGYGLWYGLRPTLVGGYLRATLTSVLVTIAATFLSLLWIAIISTGDPLGSIVATVVLTYFTTLMLGKILMPFGIATGVLLRYRQGQDISTPLAPPLRKRLKRVGQVLTSRRLWRFLLIILGLIGTTVVAVLLIINYTLTSDEVREYARSPSGKQQLRTYEGCFGHACVHRITISKRQGDLEEHFRCEHLGFTADYPVFEGAVFTWSPDESLIRWQTKNRFSGEIDVARDCKKSDSIH